MPLSSQSFLLNDLPSVQVRIFYYMFVRMSNSKLFCGKQGKAGPTLQNACWGRTPNPPGTHRIRHGCASRGRYESTVSSPLAVLFFLGAAALILAHDVIHVGLDGQ